MEKTMEQREEVVSYNRAKVWQLVLFALNNASTNIYLFTFMFVTYFSTGVLGLAAIFVSQIMGYIRIFDGFIDPAIGIIIDKTETKFGKYRPILVIGNIVTALSLILLLSLSAVDQGIRFPLFILVLIIHKIGYSMQQTITKAGQTALTNDPKQRPIFNIVDAVMTTTLMTGGQYVVSSFLVPKFGNFTPEFFKVLIYGTIVISAVLAIAAIIGIWSKDNKEFFGLGENTQKTELKDYWKVLKGNKPLQVLSIAAALVKFAVQFFGDSVVMVILFGILFGNYALSGQFSLLYVVPGVVINIIFSSIARKKGLRFSYVKALQVGLVGLVAFGAVLYFGHPGDLSLAKINMYTILFIVTNIIARFASQAPASLVLTMGADISDFETSESGRYVSGMIGTIFSLTDSIASSFAPMVVGAVLAGIGFAKAYPTMETPLTPELKMALMVLLVGVPFVALLVALVLMRFYKLDKEEMIRIQEKIQVMKAASSDERVKAIAKNVPLTDMDYVDVTNYPVDKD
ncbi:MFS transporter [Streptococcus iniae]|uniref:Glucuronide permease n=1 Tax=Streptococcus iniae TaxID=1346 RepID=A0A1J0MY36_STRIN|nr:MFS transporter [Streptococcus iniae]AGM98444.1 sugar transporter [Streptococcus iniae SF1]AHY15485.1 glucuronide permease [Streptococcus iniae]AHY17353.1 glucuronide permease [Streptococcus iniae]AJG25657.1 glucuronide permease [Streptococcus iniae]APD31527.1 glucuronide permease [Streptococcus iniae]